MAAPILSCVVDNHVKFHAQAVVWLKTLLANRADRQFDIRIHHVGPVPDQFARMIPRDAAQLVEVAPFGTGSAVYCNKLQQLSAIQPTPGQHVILCDADLAFAAAPKGLARGNALRAKLVDLPSPPAEMIAALLAEAGFGEEPIATPIDLVDDAHTHRANFNGGLYVIPSSLFDLLRERWPVWARHCLASPTIKQRRRKHSDQLSLMLTVVENNLEVDHLSERFNFPMHETERRKAYTGPEPAILHYHWMLEAPGQLSLTGYAPADMMIKRVNKVLVDSPQFIGEDELWARFRDHQLAA